MNQTTIIGIAGGSGSGKTTVTNEIMKNLEGHSVALLAQDYYYKDQSHMPFEERLKTNYDHPFAFDTDLLIEHMNKLINFENTDYMLLHFIWKLVIVTNVKPLNFNPT